jgi:SKICH domain
VTVTWSGIAAPTSTDWIGLYAVGTVNTAEITWIYVSCTQGVGAVRDSGSCAFQLPSSLTPGSYELRLFARNGYTLLATSNGFTVTP